MPIKSPEFINIKDLVIDEPERSGELDPLKLLNEQDWEEIKKIFEDTDDVFLTPGIASYLKLLAPKRLSTFKLGMNLNKVKEQLKITKKVNNFGVFLLLADAAKELYGRQAIDLNLNEYDKNQIIDVMRIVSYVTLFDMAHHFRLICPEVPINQYVTEEDWQKIKTEINENKERSHWSTAYLASSARILFPEKFSELNITKDDLQRIYQACIDLKNIKGWENFTEIAWRLKILTADDIKVTEDGIELINHPKPLPETESLPEKRKF